MEKQKRSSCAGIWITLLCCAVITAGLLILFSQRDFHQNTDNMFRELINFSVTAWNTMPWGIVILISALALPLIGALALTPWDTLMRSAPGGRFLYDRIGLSFDGRPGLRFIPAFLTIVYLIVAGFMRNADSSVSFDPVYNPFMQHSAGEWLNIIFVTLTVFSLLLITAEGIINAGPFGMLLHIPVIMTANVFLVLLTVAILFVGVNLLGILWQIIMAIILMPLFILMLALGKQQPKRF